MPSEVLQSAVRPEDSEADDTLNETIMAVDLKPRGTVGCSYYVARDETMYLMEDIEFGDVEVVDSCKLRH